MRVDISDNTNERLLSLLEAEHEALVAVPGYTSEIARAMAEAADKFRADVNRIFLAHLVPLHLHHNSRLVEVDSHEMHSAVVEPTLYLLHSQPQFASAEVAYQNALKELRDRQAGDAITDAATAL
jgi:hypothetical protein